MSERKDISRRQINSFLARAIAHASTVAIESEFDLHVRDVRVTDFGNVQINFDNGDIVIIDLEHLVPRSEAA